MSKELVTALCAAALVPVSLARIADGSKVSAATCSSHGSTSIYVETDSRWLYTFALPDGREEWRTELPSPGPVGIPGTLSIPPCGHEGYAVVGSGYGHPAQLVPFALSSGRLRRPISIGLPGQVEISPNGRTAYVANSGDIEGLSAPGGSSVTPVDLVDGRALRPIALPGEPGGIALNPKGTELLVSLLNRGAVATVSTHTMRISALITLPEPPSGDDVGGPLVVDPKNDLALVGNLQQDLGAPAGLINVINLEKGDAEAPIPLVTGTNSVSALAISSGGQSLFANVYWGVSPVNVKDRTVGQFLPDSTAATAMVVSPDGHTLYIGRDVPNRPRGSLVTITGAATRPMKSLDTTITALAIADGS